MATTTNYGWTTPDDTSLVKDGAAAIRTLGSSVDTTTKALNPSTTLGDVEYRSATANTNTRLGIGTTGQVLTVTGGVPVWATPAGGGGMTSIASGSLSGSALSLTSISGSYKNLQLVLRNADTSASCDMTLRVNNNTTGIYQRVTIYNNDAAFASAAGQNATSSQLNGSTIKLERSNTAIINFEDYANTTSYKQFMAQLSYEKVSAGLETAWTLGNLDIVAAISRIDLTLSTGTFRAGTYILYGVN
jgi:hypothetical protein